MKKIEDNLKDRFKEQQTLEGIDADQLWQGISEGLEQASPSPKARNRFFRNIGVILFVLILLVSGYVSLLYSNKEITPALNNSPLPIEQSLTNPFASKKDLQEASNNADDIIPITEAKNISNNKDSKVSKTKKTKPTNQKKESINNNQKHSTNQKDINKQQESAYTLQSLNHSLHTISPNISTIESSTKKTKSTRYEHQSPSKGKSNQVISKKTIRSNPKSLQLLPTWKSPLLKIERKSFTLFTTTPSALTKRPPVNKFQLGVFSGINTSFIQFRDKNKHFDLWNELTESHTNELGQSFSINISWIRGGKLSLSTGLNYDNIRYKFYAVKEGETTVVDNNYLVGFSIDPLTGDTIDRMYDTVQLRAMEKRTVLHHNNFKLLSIPFEIGIRKQLKKLGFGINLGIGTNFFLAQNGKTLNQNRDIQEINDQVSTERPFKKFFMSYQINPFVDFNISEKLGLRLSSTIRYQDFGSSRLYDLDQSALFINFNGGLLINL